MNEFDLIIIGGGPAGYNAAESAAKGGLSVCLFEKNALGGVCLNEGCVPSKALLNSAKIYDTARFSAKFGITAEAVKLDHGTVLARKNKVVSVLASGIAAKLKKHGVTVIKNEAVIISADIGFAIEAADETYKSKYLLICTGSAPVIPPINGLKEGIESGFVITSKEALSLPEIPEKLVIIGGGVIGLEMAEYYNSAGSRVTIIEMLDKIGGPIDEDIGRILLGNMIKSGIAFELSAKAEEIGECYIIYGRGDRFMIAADKVLLAIGRKAVLPAGLERLGVALDKGAIITDEYMRTNVPGLYAAGDVNGKSMLAHTAYREADVAVNHMLGIRDYMRYNAIPSVIYTHPEAASVGDTEKSARAKGYDIEISTMSMRYSGRYMAETEAGDGIVKVVTDAATARILGVHMIGGYASENIFGAALMIESELKVKELKELVFPHPTCGEVIRECLFEL